MAKHQAKMGDTPQLEKMRISEFFANKSLFITGGSGFIGKVLIEKLLRSCPDIKTIYLLLRAKKGKSPAKRINDLTDQPLYDLIRKDSPHLLSKLQFVEGDSSKLGLGLSPIDRQLLIDNVNIIFHGAASVRFDDPLNEAVFLNTRGTRELAQLALEMRNLQVLLHISTTYCNTDRKVIGEQLYPAHADWRKTIDIMEQLPDKTTLNVLTNKYIEPLPNTYTFTKSLAEHVICDMCTNHVPAVIFRPSIVISTAREPFPGWIDNFNGPIGLMLASGKGVVRTVYADPDLVADYIPVDLVAKALIISAWKKGTENDRSTVTFYNGSNNEIKSAKISEIIEMGYSFLSKATLNDIIWYPNGGVTKCYAMFLLRFYFYQLLPALLIDTALKIAGYQPLLVKINRRIFVAISALSFFLSQHWTFKNDNALSLESTILEEDREQFAYNSDNLERWEYFYNASLGARRYLLKESDESLPEAKRHANRMWYLAKVFNFVWYMVIVWILYKVDAIGMVANKWHGYVQYWSDL